jgi:hypothetical protein
MARITLCLLLAAATSAVAADLPVKQVTLYKNGVGHYVRAGEIPAGESVSLQFRTEQMNDILKTLTVSAQGGGVRAIRYDSSEPLAKKLQDFGFKAGAQQSLGEFLDQFKGARIELHVGNATVDGVILSGRRVAPTQQQPERQEVLLILDGGEMRAVDLSSASSLRFTDSSLQKKLTDYLAILAGARSNELRSLTVEAEGAGARQVTLSYLVPSPVWKSTYRLLLGDKNQATLEGWAIVDNTTGEDWNNVSLAMMSGRPVSFVMDLYEPEYRNRPTAELPEDQAVAPELHGGVVGGIEASAAPAPPPAMREVPRMAARAEEMQSAQAKARGGFGGNVTRLSDTAGAAYSVAPSTAALTAAAREAGELFEYRVSQPVTIRKGESAMLPFTQGAISARRVVVYSDPSSENPRNAAEISNNTGKTLDGGPIAIYDAGAYAGEALMETLKKDDKRLVSYAVDLGTRITSQFGSRRTDVREVHFSRGILHAKRAQVQTVTYTIRNVDAKAKTLILEQAAIPGAELTEPKTAEKTANAYRFEVELAPSGNTTFTAVQESPVDESYAVANLTPDVLIAYTANKSLSEAARSALQQLAGMKQKIAAVDKQVSLANEDVQSLSQDENRLRSNINTLNGVAGQQDQVQKYSTELAALEGRIVGRRDQLAKLRDQKAALESELNAVVEKLEF